MAPTPLQTLTDRLSRLIENARRSATRKATCRALAPFGPALRDDLGLTRHRQMIIFTNDRYQKHSFD